MRKSEHRRGVVLAMVLILGLLLSTAVVSFSHRSMIDSLVSRNRDNASQAEALARGGLQVALALLLEDALADAAAMGAGNASNSGDYVEISDPIISPVQCARQLGYTRFLHCQQRTHIAAILLEAFIFNGDCLFELLDAELTLLVVYVGDNVFVVQYSFRF